MASSKSLVVGRRLRRMLGTLLVSGFGLAWWSFVPATVAADPVVDMPAQLTKEPLAKEPPGPCVAPMVMRHEPARVARVETRVVAKPVVAKPVTARPPVIAKPPVVAKPVIASVVPVVPKPQIDVPRVVLPKPPPDDLEILIRGRSS